MQYPGGLAARYRWAGTGQSVAVFAVSEATGPLHDLGSLVGIEPDRLCRAELRVEGPLGTWTARFASLIYDEPQAVLWDTPGLLLVKYGFRLYALGSRTGELAWSHASGTPIVAVLASSRVDHALLQTEIETVALREQGEVAWRAAHSDVVTAAELVGGRLVLTSYGGQLVTLDPRTGQPLD
ncbi:MAG TPA: PQQ-binding-like beta-propeller repeat protein [Candidatus Caenarcaniphilales bacterium]|nr:PQQ-binding-like beta-propeller repeat protein [Candidatus Caenarcaniphilales bacterium]